VGRGLPLRGGALTRALRIRTWLLVGLLLFVLLTALFYHVTTVLDQQVLQPSLQQQTRQQDAAADATLHEIARSPARGHNPEWQAALRGRLARIGVDALILDPSGATIFRSGHPGAWMQPSHQAVVLDLTAANGPAGAVFTGTLPAAGPTAGRTPSAGTPTVAPV
jgi:hypothetical protein